MMIQELRNEVKRLQTKLRSNSNAKEDENDEMGNNGHAHGRNGFSNNQAYNNDMEDYKAILGAHPKKLDRPEVKALKAEITHLFDEEFRLRNDLLKLDGAMLQSALDCEILRLMVLDWENLKTGNNSDGEGMHLL